MRSFQLSCAGLAMAAVLAGASCANTIDGGGNDGGGGGSDGNNCSEYDDAVGDEVLVHFQNAGTEEIYLSTWCGKPDRPQFSLLRGGNEVKIDDSCSEGNYTNGGTCTDKQEGNNTDCSSDICEVGELIRIERDMTYTFAWNATEQVLASMPGDCYTAPEEAQCWQKIKLEPGDYKATGQYYRRIDVEQGAGCPCELTTDTDGVCIVDKNTCALYTGNPALPVVDVTLPSSDGILFVIGP